MYSQYIVLPEGLSFSKTFSVKPTPVYSLWSFLATIPDPRRAQGRRHSLPIVLLLAVFALCCGSNSYEAMEDWAKNYQSILSQQFPFASGHTPDAATFHRVFARLNVGEFEEILRTWMETIMPIEKGEGIAIDGKTISGTGVHVVAAFSHTLCSVLFEMGTDVKGKELVVGPQVLSTIALKDHVITGDAMFTQKKICEQIMANGGGYVFTVKGNQASMEQAIRLYFTDLPFKAHVQSNTTMTRHKGRVEKRTVVMSQELNEYINWPGLTHVWQCTRERKEKGKTTTEIAVGIASLPVSYATAEKLNQYIRGHWGIENRLHRQRDVIFDEDKSSIRKGTAPQLMAALKNIVINIFHRAAVRSFPTAFRRFAAKPEELFTFLGLDSLTTQYMYE